MQNLNVVGFGGHLTALNGNYNQQGENHGKPVFRKRAELEGAQQCCVYFWDERDGEALAGWWMAPEVGGEQVWTHSVSRSQLPPAKGWKVPWHSAVPDPAVTMEVKQPGTVMGTKRPQDNSGMTPLKRVQTAPGQWAPSGQGQQVQSQSGSKWGAQDANGWQNKTQVAAQGKGANKKGAGAAPQQQQARGGVQSGGKGGQQQQQQQKGSGKGGPPGPNPQQVQKTIAQVNQSVATAEKAVEKLSSEESKKDNFDKTRHVTLARLSLTSATRCIEGHIKTKWLEESAITTQRGKLTKCEVDLSSFELQIKKEKDEELKKLSTLVSEVEVLVTDLEKQVEKTKDAAVLFTCEMAEHIEPEEAVRAKEKTDAEAKISTEKLQKAKSLIFAKEKVMRTFSPAEVDPIKEKLKPLQARLGSEEKEINNVKRQSMQGAQKAQVALAKKKREEAVVKQREERDRVVQWNKSLIHFAFEVALISESYAKKCKEDSSEEMLQDAEEKIKGFKKELTTRMSKSECHANTKQQVVPHARKVDSVLARIAQSLKEQLAKDQDEVHVVACRVACAAREKYGEKDRSEFFKSLTGRADKMDGSKFEKFISQVGVSCDCTALLFKEICKIVGSETTTLTEDEFYLHVMNCYHKVVKQTIISKEEDPATEKVGSLDVNSYVQVIEGPTSFAGAMRVKIQTTKEEEPLEGWVTLRKSAIDYLQRFSPHYVVLSETVLTDTFDLKKFKVVRRIKKGEKFRAVLIPKYNKESQMSRILGVTETNERAYVTIQGNRGTPLLENQSPAAAEKKDEKDDENMDEFAEDVFQALVQTLAKETIEGSKRMMTDLDNSTEKIEETLKKLETFDEEDKELKQEDVVEVSKELEEVFLKQKETSSKAMTSMHSFLKELVSVTDGPYSEVKVELNKLLEELKTKGTAINKLREQQRTLLASVRQKEAAARLAAEKLEQEGLAAKLIEELKPQAEKIDDLLARLEKTEQTEQPTLVDSCQVFNDYLVDIKTRIAGIKEEGEAVKVWFEENIPKKVAKGALIEAQRELVKKRAVIIAISQKADLLEKSLLKTDVLAKEKQRVDLAVSLQKYLKKKSSTADKLYDQIAKDGKLEFPAFEKAVKKICPGMKNLDRLCIEAVGTTTLSKDHLNVLTRCYYRCIKKAAIGSKLEVRSLENNLVKIVELDEVVEVAGNHEFDEETNLIRFPVKILETELEGFGTVSGNKGSNYFELVSSGYLVTKETVFTDKFEMEGFKILKRLKANDILRALTNPELEEKSGLWRLKCSTLEAEGATVGWVTLKGNQGSKFLKNCALPPPAEKEDKMDTTEDKKEDVEMTAA